MNGVSRIRHLKRTATSAKCTEIMKLHEFLSICNDYDKLLDFLIQKNVIHGTMNCTKCNQPMTFLRKSLMFQCRKTVYVKNRNKKRLKTECATKISAYRDTWFQYAHLNIQNICRFIAYHVMLRPPRQDFIRNELNITQQTAVNWASVCRELCVLWVEKESVMIGGENETVEINEAKIRKRKDNKGRLITGQWIFGGFERSTKRVFIQPVQDRTSGTLLDVIKRWIKPGTTIISHCWKSYDCLSMEGFKHLTVNHRMNFVDPNTGARTQRIGHNWRETRANIPRYGIRNYHYVSYVAEYMFRRKYDLNNRITAFFDIMADIFPANNTTEIIND